MLKISTTPHIFSPVTTQSLMRDVLIALTPAIIVALLMFGIGALKVLLTSVAACVMFEYLITRYLLKTANTIRDCSAMITGVLLAFNLPSSMPAWMILVGAFVAIGITKMAFGGLGKNIFNPALAGRVFLFISFPVQMTTWPKPDFLNFMNIDAETAPTTLNILKHINDTGSAAFRNAASSLPDYRQMLIGNMGGSLGEVSALALLLGMFYMLWKKIITWHVPVSIFVTVFVFTGIMHLVNPVQYASPFVHLLSGGLMLGAIFMATDYVTSPMSKSGMIVYGVGIGILTTVIRLFGSYPEGMSFAIFIMNGVTPLINSYMKPKHFGGK